MSVTKPVACQSDDVTKPSVTCGAGDPTWVRLTSAHLVNTFQPATPVCSTFTIDADGVINLAWNNAVLERDGYNEGDRFAFDPTLIDSTYTTLTHLVEFYMEELTTFPTSGQNAQVGWGLATAAAVATSLTGASAVRLHNSAPSQKQMNQLLTAGPNAGIGTSVISGDGTYWSSHRYLGNRAPVSFSYRNTTPIWSSALTGATDTADPTNTPYLIFHAGKDSNTNANGDTFQCALYVRLVNVGGTPP